MNKARIVCKAPKQAQQGFTLVELVTVVILLGVLALAVAPRFMGSSGFVEYALQKRLIASLRNTQLKAMFDTRSSFCYRTILVTGSSSSAAFGPSSKSYLSGNESASCSTNIDSTSPSFLRSSDGEINAEGISLSALDNSTSITYLQFDNYGKPYTSAGTCASGCVISFTGESTAKICVADQGYVYACE